MKVVLQKVNRAAVIVREKKIASIERGLLLLVGFVKADTKKQVRQMVKKVLKFRIFEDENNKMNYSVLEVKGEILLVPNFTLCADTEKGNRPSFAKAAAPDKADQLFNSMAKQFGEEIAVQTGAFGAHMEVGLHNDGPVTFILES